MQDKFNNKRPKDHLSQKKEERDGLQPLSAAKVVPLIHHTSIESKLNGTIFSKSLLPRDVKVVQISEDDFTLRCSQPIELDSHIEVEVPSLFKLADISSPVQCKVSEIISTNDGEFKIKATFHGESTERRTKISELTQKGRPLKDKSGFWCSY